MIMCSYICANIHFQAHQRSTIRISSLTSSIIYNDKEDFSPLSNVVDQHIPL